MSTGRREWGLMGAAQQRGEDGVGVGRGGPRESGGFVAAASKEGFDPLSEVPAGSWDVTNQL